MENNYNVLISYDVDGKQPQIKEELLKRGYSDSYILEGKVYHLPDTTLWKANTNTIVAKADLISICSSLNVKLERLVATEFVRISAVQGTPYKI